MLYADGPEKRVPAQDAYRHLFILRIETGGPCQLLQASAGLLSACEDKIVLMIEVNKLLRLAGHRLLALIGDAFFA